MDLSLERENGGWYDALPRRGGVYDLASAALAGKTQNERLQAVVALGKSADPRAVRPLADLLGDPDPGIRLSAITALGQLKSGRPVDELIVRLRDKNEDAAIRRETLTTLAAIRSTGAIHGLREFAADDAEDPDLRHAAEMVLGKIGTR